MMNNHIRLNLIRNFQLITFYQHCISILAKKNSRRKYFCYVVYKLLMLLYVSELIEQDAHSNLAKILQAFSFLNFDV